MKEIENGQYIRSRSIHFNTVVLLLLIFSVSLEASSEYLCIDPQTQEKKLVFVFKKNKVARVMTPDRKEYILPFRSEGKVRNKNHQMGDVIGEYNSRSNSQVLHIYYNSYPKSKNIIGVVWTEAYNGMYHYICQKQ